MFEFALLRRARLGHANEVLEAFLTGRRSFGRSNRVGYMACERNPSPSRLITNTKIDFTGQWILHLNEIDVRGHQLIHKMPCLCCVQHCKLTGVLRQPTQLPSGNDKPGTEYLSIVNLP